MTRGMLKTALQKLISKKHMALLNVHSETGAMYSRSERNVNEIFTPSSIGTTHNIWYGQNAYRV